MGLAMVWSDFKKFAALIALVASIVGAPTKVFARDVPPLTIARDGSASAVIVVSPKSGVLTQRAAKDLQKYIELMSGARLPVIATNEGIDEAVRADTPLIVVGEKTFDLNPAWKAELLSKAKPNPEIRSDAILMRREGKRVYLVGTNDRSNYFAVARLLAKWGVRWFMPGDFGEVVPDTKLLQISTLDEIQATPFEIRTSWISWLGDPTGIQDFQLRNLMTDASEVPPNGHTLGKYTKGLGESAFDFSLLGEKTAQQIANETEKLFAANSSFSLGMEDGLYSPDKANQGSPYPPEWDKSFLDWSITDSMLTLYGRVLNTLRSRYPKSTSKVGFLAYSNMTLPPVGEHSLDKALFAMLAPIDIDPIHGAGDTRSPMMLDYARMIKGWSRAMNGRVAIYDYDQSMLVWRDLPNPSHMAFQRNIKLYRDANILGVSTESRNALATIGINMYLRAQLMWNPDVDVGSLLRDFYQSFYGPAAKPMADYWSAIFGAWDSASVMEHEFFVAPAIYTPALLEKLEVHLREAEAALRDVAWSKSELTRSQRQFVERLRFTRLGFEVMKNYIGMVQAGATEVNYDRAVDAGLRGMGARTLLSSMSESFVSSKLEKGPAFWPGEVYFYEGLKALTDGTWGKLVARLPLEWDLYEQTKAEQNAARGWRARGSDTLPVAAINPSRITPDERTGSWKRVRTDLYLEAQGTLAPKYDGMLRPIWIKTSFDLAAADISKNLRLHFPGIFGSCALSINEKLVAERQQKALWWLNDYNFEWDVPVSAHVVAGKNRLMLNCSSNGRLSGMFRRPFLYKALNE